MYSPSKHSHVCTNHASRDIYTSNENIDTYVPIKSRHSRVPTNPYYETHTHASNTNKQTCQPYRSLTRTNQTHTRTYQPPFRLCLPILRPHLAQPRFSSFFAPRLAPCYRYVATIQFSKKRSKVDYGTIARFSTVVPRDSVLRSMRGCGGAGAYRQTLFK